MVGLDRSGLLLDYTKKGRNHRSELMPKSNSGAGWNSRRSVFEGLEGFIQSGSEYLDLLQLVSNLQLKFFIKC